MDCAICTLVCTRPTRPSLIGVELDELEEVRTPTLVMEYGTGGVVNPEWCTGGGGMATRVVLLDVAATSASERSSSGSTRGTLGDRGGGGERSLERIGRYPKPGRPLAASPSALWPPAALAWLDEEPLSAPWPPGESANIEAGGGSKFSIAMNYPGGIKSRVVARRLRNDL